MESPENQSPSKEHVWHQLKEHHRAIATLHMRDLFAQDPARAKKFSTGLDGLLIDFSKHRITDETFELLISLANAANIKEKISALFSGQQVNTTEHRAALHTALRSPDDKLADTDQTTIPSQVKIELERMYDFVKALHNRQHKGSTGKPISKVVNIGIGGSDLGPRLVVDALYDYRSSNIEIAFVANLDTQDLYKVLDDSDPETTLFIVTSKSFSTLETYTNAQQAKQWLIDNGCHEIQKHFIAVSSNKSATQEFGISADRLFQIWDWVGGRYSVWSVVGLAIAVHTDNNSFADFLAGAHAMDEHFYNAPAKNNIPIILAMLDVWYNNFFNAETHAVVPYDQGLQLLPAYLSQLIMESNGKGVTSKGQALELHSSPVFWGSVGTNAQHAFFQLLHQGTRLIPVDFLLAMHSSRDDNHYKVVANCLAQSKALMLGQENTTEPYKHFPGNRPSTTITYPKLSPKILGMLLAMYEHRTYVQAMIWDINPFDQWGVELGKKLATEIISDLEQKTLPESKHDASTTLLIEHYFKHKT